MTNKPFNPDKRGSQGEAKAYRYYAEKLGIEDDLPFKKLEQVEEALGFDNYTEQASFDRAQVEQLCRNDLNFLSAVCMPEVFQFLFPPTHIAIWQLLLQGIQEKHKFPQFALGIPRGHAKTTLIKLVCIYAILFTDVKFILVTASNERRAIDIVSDIMDMLSEPNVKTVFGDWKNGAETDSNTLKKFGYRGRNIAIAAIGAEGSVRGINIKNTRPDLIIFEDIQTKECADSEIQSKSLESWMIGTAMKAKNPTGCMFIYVGNMFPTQHSILKKLKSNPSWTKFISGAILADGSALWPELRSLESLLKELDNDIAMGHPEIFFSEVLNDTEAGINNQVDLSKFPDWLWGEQELPQGKFIIIDPSTGKGKDHDVIACFEVYDETLGLRDLVEDHFSPGNLIRKALVVAIKNNINLIVVESIAYQYTLLYWFEEVCKSAGITGISFVPIYATSTSKNARITSAIKAMQSKEIILHPDVKSIVQRQIMDWNPMKRDNTDDILDCIAHAPKALAEYAYDMMSPWSLEVSDTNSAKVIEDNHIF